MHCKLPPTTPKCPLYSRTFKKTQTPIYDALGPFPDEIIMSSIDRVLFFFGGKRVQKWFNSKHSSKEDDSYSCSSIQTHAKHKTHHNCDRVECYVKESPTYSVVKISKDDKSDKSPSYSPYSNTPRIKVNSSRQESGKIGISLRALKKSFSLCSLACRKLKDKLSLASPTSFVSPKWLWTKVDNYADGCQIYEVFKNSSAANHPSKFDKRNASKIIFVMLPTGIIMPFETLPRH